MLTLYEVFPQRSITGVKRRDPYHQYFPVHTHPSSCRHCASSDRFVVFCLRAQMMGTSRTLFISKEQGETFLSAYRLTKRLDLFCGQHQQILRVDRAK
jgi:hypothetical protein